MSLTKATYSMIQDAPTNIVDFGADATGVADSTAAIVAAIAASNFVYIPSGTYKTTTQIDLKSNLIVQFAGNATIQFAGNATTYAFNANTCTDIVVRDGQVLGTAIAGYSLFRFVSCANIEIQNCTIKQSGSMGLQFESCNFVKVDGCDLSNNYYYGISDTDGTNNKYTNNLFYGNGSTGIATTTGGRGINLRRCVSCFVSGNRFAANTEYGFRIYSEAADASASYNNVISGNNFYDNTRTDFVLYDESLAGTLVKNNIISDNIVQRSTEPSLGVFYLLHGGKNTFVNNRAYKSGAFSTAVAFNFYYAVDCTMIGCSAENITNAISLPGSNNIVIDTFTGTTVATAISSLSGTAGGIVVKNSKFTHGGAGASDVAINSVGVATAKNWYDGNTFDGFHTGIYIGDEPIAVYRNTSINSTFAGLRKSGNDLSNQEFGNNSWDVTAPAILESLQKDKTPNSRAIVNFNVAPLALTWSVGDRCYNFTPSVGQPKSWVCTVAGTPGTWVSEGNL